jgi:hypothetical protein
MGVSYNEFWELTPRSLNVIKESYKLKRKVQDEEQWLLGGYMFSAVSIALGNAFRKKNQKTKSYFEELKEPFLKGITDKPSKGEMSEEEKQKHIDALMARLHIMQNNFNTKHGK